MKRPPAISKAIESGSAPFRGRRAASLLPKTRLGGPMPWVIAIMVALTVLAAGGALALSNMVSAASGDLADQATIQLIEADAELREQKITAIAELLSQDEAVAGFRRVPDDDIAELLEPWLGGDSESEIIPLPALIDVELRSDSGPETFARLGSEIEGVADGARIDAQSDWLAPVLAALSALRWIALGLIALLAFVGIAAVWLAARNALGTNRDTIEIVHHLGGSDDQIARVFQRSILLDALAGGALGLVAGLGAILLVATQFAALQSGMVAGGSLSAIDWAIIALVPLFAVAIAVYTARMTVLSSLRKTL